MEEKEKQEESSKDKKESLETRFSRERLEWKEKIESMSRKMKNVLDLISLEIDVFSSRQIALEYSYSLMYSLSNINARIRKLNKAKYLHYVQDFDLKLDKPTRDMFIAIDLEKMILRQELVNNHLSYIKETVISIDKIIYGIKWRIDLEHFKRENI